VPSAPENQPGALRGVVTLTLETRQAQRLVKGRPGTADKPAIIGLIGFANRLRAIWQGARLDDPYADWWLIKVHDALEVADQALTGSIDAVQSCLATSEAISATPGASMRPARTPLRFSNPYAFRGAHLVAKYDRLVRAVLTARHIGVMTRDDAARICSLGSRQLRRTFLSPLGYRLMGVTRQDVSGSTARNAQARESMGEIPADVVNGGLRAPHAPVRPPPASSLAQYLDPQSPAAKS
jgi:integrating conjugative element protein (TIGR03761 family)